MCLCKITILQLSYTESSSLNLHVLNNTHCINSYVLDRIMPYCIARIGSKQPPPPFKGETTSPAGYVCNSVCYAPHPSACEGARAAAPPWGLQREC